MSRQTRRKKIKGPTNDLGSSAVGCHITLHSHGFDRKRQIARAAVFAAGVHLIWLLRCSFRACVAFLRRFWSISVLLDQCHAEVIWWSFSIHSLHLHRKFGGTASSPVEERLSSSGGRKPNYAIYIF